MAGQTTLTGIEDLAKRLCYEHDPNSVWAAEDETLRLHYRLVAVQQLAPGTCDHVLPRKTDPIAV